MPAAWASRAWLSPRASRRCRNRRATSMVRVIVTYELPNSQAASARAIDYALLHQALALLKWPTEVREHPEGQQVHTQKRLNARHDTHPPRRPQRVLTRLEARDPVPDV